MSGDGGSAPLVRRVRAVAAARAVWGSTLLVAPDRVLDVVAGRPAGWEERAVVRLLGVRHLVQAVVTAARPQPPVPALGSVVDALHAASMVVLARTDRRRARLAGTSAALATSWCVLGSWAARRQPPAADQTATVNPATPITSQVT